MVQRHKGKGKFRYDFLQTIYHQAWVLHGECLYIVYRNKIFLLLVIFIYSDSNLIKQDFSEDIQKFRDYENVSGLSQAENPQI